MSYLLLEHMHKKFKINRTKIKGGCQSGIKVVTHNSNSDLLLVFIMRWVCTYLSCKYIIWCHQVSNYCHLKKITRLTSFPTQFFRNLVKRWNWVLTNDKKGKPKIKFIIHIFLGRGSNGWGQISYFWGNQDFNLFLFC